MSETTLTPEQSQLGRKSTYIATYDPTLLFPILRKQKRAEINIHDNNNLPFQGFDYWNHYEISWLNTRGKPIAALAEIVYPCDSPCLIESKSMKLYFNSFNNTKFSSTQEVEELIKKDLSKYIEKDIYIKIIPIDQFSDQKITKGFVGKCLDTLDVECDEYHVNPRLLIVNNNIVDESLYSDLLKSNCLVTGQPDWGSILINYRGKQINPAGLLKYIISYRNHNGFAEHCVEQIFMDILQYCKPQELTVYARYTRRGGLDINPLRSTEPVDFHGYNQRFCRQ